MEEIATLVDSNAVTVELTGISPEKEAGDDDPDSDDNYRRTELTRTVYIRNLNI